MSSTKIDNKVMTVDKERIQLNLRLDGHRELLNAIKLEAEAAGISVNAFVINTLKIAVGQTKTKTQTPIAPPANLEQTLAPVLDKLLADKFAAIEERLGKLKA